ncbi:MAG TPA: alginate export family protein [Gemmataceae bacterium]|nr:alginate export family protein [Gemmataceae bacterium]
MCQGRAKVRQHFWRWACSAGLGALLTAGAGVSLGQTTPATPPASPAPSAAAPAVIEPGTVVEAPSSWVEGGQPADAPSVWAKVPPPFQYTKIGGMFVLPTGPGYYSFCDLLKGNYRENPPVFPVPPFGLIPPVPYFDANYRYLDKPDNEQTNWADCTKRIHLGDNWMFSIGGEERIRYNNEVDSRLTGKDNVYESYRSRVYADLWYRDVFRVYVEYFDANVSNQDLPRSPSDVNKSDLLNLFAEVKVFELGGQGVYVRGGRQELYYGSQRLVSPTDFPNATRTFDGVKGYWHSEKLDVDGFWTRPVVIDPSRFDSENDKATFAGAWATCKPAKGQYIDLYYLYLDNDTPLPGRPVPGARGGFDVNTFGARATGDYKFLMWDFEGMYQFGEHGAQTTSAGAYDLGLGTHCANLPLNPTFWVYYDYASGNHNPGKGQYGTFNQLFPNGHAYFGGTDLVGRQNIQDLNFDGWITPCKWVIVGLQYHILRLDAAKDALYSAAGTVERSDPTGRAGTNVGEVVTSYTNFHLSAHSDLLLQYSHLSAGAYIKATGPGGSPDECYVQYIFRW